LICASIGPIAPAKDGQPYVIIIRCDIEAIVSIMIGVKAVLPDGISGAVTRKPKA
jgi:hypothetical protein